ncbi:MFS transporter [Edwardsiella piscicida]
MLSLSRPVLLLLCGLLLLTVAMALLNTLVPLWLDQQHLATWQVGLVGSAYFLGNLVGTLVTGRVILRRGFNQSYYYACLLFAASTAALGIASEFWGWLLWRFLAGIGCAMIWVIVESALLRSGSNANRGQLLAAYMTIYYLGTVLGQLALGVISTALLRVIPWTTALMVVAMLPLCFARIERPQPRRAALAIWPLLRRRSARLGVNGCVISGAIQGTLYGLLPLYLSHQGISDARVGYWMALLVSAGILGQWPVGRLADRYGRLRVLRVQVTLLILGSLVMLSTPQGALAALVILGGAGFTLYPVAMSWACERADRHELVAMNQALLMSYTLGSLAGPTLVALLMQHFSDRWMFVTIAAIALCYGLMLWRRPEGHSALPAA